MQKQNYDFNDFSIYIAVNLDDLTNDGGDELRPGISFYVADDGRLYDGHDYNKINQGVTFTAPQKIVTDGAFKQLILSQIESWAIVCQNWYNNLFK